MSLTLVPERAARWAMLSTYPPTWGETASYAKALRAALLAAGTVVDVVRMVAAGDEAAPADAVVHVWQPGPGSNVAASDVLNGYDVVVVQHEFGNRSGPDGEEVLGLLGGLEVPVVTALHGVPREPTARERLVLDGIVATSELVVTRTDAARDAVVAHFGASPHRVVVVSDRPPQARRGRTRSVALSAEGRVTGIASGPVWESVAAQYQGLGDLVEGDLPVEVEVVVALDLVDGGDHRDEGPKGVDGTGPVTT